MNPFRPRLIRPKIPLIYSMGLMIYFWALADAIISYITPLAITSRGFSMTQMGIILSFSSICGALFDFWLCRWLKKADFRRFFFLFFMICSVYPLLLWRADRLWMFLGCMMFWGLNYDLYSFGIFNFVGHHTGAHEHSASFSLISIFKLIGVFIGPVIAAFIWEGKINLRVVALVWIFLLVSFLIFLWITKKHKEALTSRKGQSETERVGLWKELVLWKKIARTLFPVLCLSCFLYIVDAFFWTIGPVFAESLKRLHPFGGFFNAAYILPSILIFSLIGPVTRKIGKKKTAFLSLFLGSAVLLLLNFFSNPILVILIVFLFSLLSSLAWPAIQGAYADYISESPQVEKEIAGLEDFFVNLGYVVGPIFAGVSADKLGEGWAFFALGVTGMVVAVILYLVTPKSIRVKVSAK